MSFQELHIRALEDQVLNLTRDCYYLMSLLNSTDEIDWDSWEQGRKIKEDLERSKDFFNAIQRRQNTQNDCVQQRRENEVARIQRERNENACKACEQLKLERAQYASRKMKENNNDSEKYARRQFFSPLETKGYVLSDYLNDIFNGFKMFRLFP